MTNRILSGKYPHYLLWIIGISTLFITMSSCASVYQTSDSRSLAVSHKWVAIVPPTISIQVRKPQEAEVVEKQQQMESMNFQKEIYNQLLKRKSWGQFNPDLMDIQTINAKLKKAGYPDTPMTTADYCRILGVDAIITSHFDLSKPISEGGAVAVAVAFGTSVATNSVRATLQIIDASTTKMIWSFSHEVNGHLGSTTSSVVERVVRSGIRRMPYNR
jgi:hypothetical protein